MSNATQQWVSERMFPLERQLQEAQDAIGAINAKWASRDADLASAEKRFEELALKMKELEDAFKNFAGLPQSGGSGHTSQGVLRSPALRNLVAYSGDHRHYGKWRSKIKGVLFGESNVFKCVLKILEAPDRAEIPDIVELILLLALAARKGWSLGSLD